MSRNININMGHSSDADDAFMWWPLGDEASGRRPAFDTGDFRFTIIADDIEQLNQRAMACGDLDVSAISMHTFALTAQRYALCACGNSFGEGYGPKVVSRWPTSLEELAANDCTFAVPGQWTTAFLVLEMIIGDAFGYLEMPYSEISKAVWSGRCEAGILIHEEQVTFADAGFELLIDQGQWWRRQTGLPLPLGANVIRRDLDERHGAGAARQLARLLRQSLEMAFYDRSRGLEAVSQFVPGLPREVSDAFVKMYVNERTLDCGEEGQRAVELLFAKAAEDGFLAAAPQIEVISA